MTDAGGRAIGGAGACAACGADVPADAPGGACPRCAFAAALPAASADPTPEEVAAKLPAFEILGVLGRGGMGVVFKARQKALDRVVALKVLPPATARAPGFAERFVREAKAMARLQHPNIVAVHDFGVGEGLSWLSMEFVDGMNVREAMARGRVAPKEALAIVPQICDALQYAHDRGVVHRDIKPENVLIDREGRVRIADFGLAKLADRETGDPSLTGASQVMGTLHYMAPEQWERPKEVDHRADIYSLGVVFYEMLTGELPVGKFEPPSKKAAIDVRVDEVVMRSLERNREQRWQRADDVKTKVSAITSGEVPAPSQPTAVPVRSLERDGLPSLGALVVPVVPLVAMSVLLSIGKATGNEWCTRMSGPMLAVFVVDVILLGFVLPPGRIKFARDGTRLARVHAAVTGAVRRWLLARWFLRVPYVLVSAIAVSFVHSNDDVVGLILHYVSLALGAVVFWLLVRRWRAIVATSGAPVGPPEALEFVAMLMLVTSVLCVGWTWMEHGARPSEPEFGPPGDLGEEPPADAVVEAPAHRSPWGFEIVRPEGEDRAHKPWDSDPQGIASMWAKAQALQGGKWSNALAELYPLEDSSVLQWMSDERRAEAVAQRAIGPLFLPKKEADLLKFRIERVELAGWSSKGRFTTAIVEATDGARTLRFPMRLGRRHEDSDETWLFAIAPLELR